MDIRIYYEAIEQGITIKNIISKLININTSSITLIKKRKQSYNNWFKVAYSKEMSKILSKKNPDIIISYIFKWIEYPIFIIEFSTAVFTKDHEQQRADNYIVAANSNALYIKISPISKDSWNHWWDTNYSYIEPYSLFYKKYNELSFHIEWETDKNISKLLKHDKFKSLPKNISDLSMIFSLFFNNASNFIPYKWKNDFLDKEIINNNFIKEWFEKINNYKEYEDIKKLNSTRTTFLNKDSNLNIDNVFYLKFNRFWHAMDPERWMLIFYNSFLIDNWTTVVSKIIMDLSKESWYKDTNNEDNIKKYIYNKKSLSNEDLLNLFFLWLNLKWLNEIKINNINNIFDINEYVDKYYLNSSIPFRNIIDNSNYLNLTDWTNNLYLKWDKKNRDFNYDILPDITYIEKQKDYSEDDVTYISINNIFNDNLINIVSVSYPWAQSDMPILPETAKWRSQKRLYIDIIWTKWENLYFQENKWPFKKKEIIEDINKISLFKNDISYIEAVNNFSKNNNINFKRLIIWVWFWNSKSFSIDEIWIEKIDYFVIIDKNKNIWKIFTNNINWIFTKTTWNILELDVYDVKDI